MNLFQHGKNPPISPICSGDIDHLKILKSDSLRAKAHISGTRVFPNKGFVQKHNTSFHYRKNSVKINDQIFH